jgi:predicted dinucleotide-binding enzyme
MNLGILGTGNVGSTLGKRFAEQGHSVLYGSREPEGDKVKKLLDDHPGHARAVETVELPALVDLIVLAVPFGALDELIPSLGLLDGTILVDATNPLAQGLSGLVLGFDTSAAENVSRLAPRARVVKAFNTVGSKVMENPVYGEQRAFLPVAADDPEAKETVLGLARELGFDAVDAGPLSHARYLEPLAMLWIQLAYPLGHGNEFAFVKAERS